VKKWGGHGTADGLPLVEHAIITEKSDPSSENFPINLSNSVFHVGL
jgi:hypothetical protein